MASAAIGPDFDWTEAEEEVAERVQRDAELLGKFRDHQDGAAFQSLVERHGPLVLDVCRSVLRNAADADDAFQETFVVLANSASSIRKTESLGSWLHGVAFRTSQKARTRLAIRRKHESSAKVASEAAFDDANWRETLHGALSELPERFRTPLVLCYLQGATQEAAATEIGVAKSTLRERLEKGRELLRSKLVRAGLGPTAMLAFAAWHTASASASVPSDLVANTMTTITNPGSSSLVGGATMVGGTMTVAAFVALVGIGAAVAMLTPESIKGTSTSASAPAAITASETDDQKATRLATIGHAQAKAIDKLPRLSYETRYRYGLVDSLRAVDTNLETMSKALKDPVLEKDWIGFYEKNFLWDEKHLFDELRPAQFRTAYNYRFGTREDAWERSESEDHKSKMFVRRNNIGEFWNTPDHPFGSTMHYFELSYFRLTHHEFWWGKTVNRTGQTMSFMTLDEVNWKLLPAETFGDELCDVVESENKKTSSKGQRLWIGQKSGRVRGVLAYLDRSSPNDLVRFDDYREVAPGVWLPFRETRAYPHGSDIAKDKHKLFRSELIVDKVRTDRDLAEHFKELLPQDGDRMQDQRFGTALNFKYLADRTDDETRKLAEIQKKKELEGLEEFHKIVKPLADLMGNDAPALPIEGWLGGKKPEIVGKPYLVHFWATWCGPCKGDLPRLRALSEQGLTIVGVHPPGTSPDEIEKLIADQKLNYPTVLAADDLKSPNGPKLAGYPAGVFPYCVLVDSRGRVSAHGLLSDVESKLHEAVLLSKYLGKPAAELRGLSWFNSHKGIDLKEQKGKVVLLDFWGQWCGPCVAKLPEVEGLHAKFKDQGLVVIGVHSAKESDNLEAFLKSKKVTFPVVIDDGKTAEVYQVDSWPRYVLIDRAGKIAGGFSFEPPSAKEIEGLLKDNGM